MQILDGFEFHRMTATPRPVPAAGTRSDAEIDAGIAAQLFAAVSSVHAHLSQTEPAGAFAVAWDRPTHTRQLRILVGGSPYCPLTEGHALLYPPGSQAVPIDTALLHRQWNTLTWIRCEGRPDALWTPDTSQPAVPGRGGFEDYINHITGRFAWLVVAEPLDAEALEHDIMRLETDLSEQRASPNWEPARLAVTRGEKRHRELSRALATGIWNIHLLVGAENLPNARAAAAILCAASDLDGHPYTLRPDRTGPGADLSRAWTAAGPGTDREFGSPFVATAELLTALARPPRRELPGIRVTEPAHFDVTADYDPADPTDAVAVGDILDATDQPVGEFAVPLATLNRHTFVAGATGSGKSQTVRRILDGLHTAEIPWLVIEPAKAEYAGMAGRIGEPVTVIRPGDPDAIPVGINPLQPAPGFPLQTHIDLTRALFLAAFDPAEPFPQVLAHALNQIYTDLGWNPVLSASNLDGITPKYPNLGDLQRTALTVVDGIGYSREITDNVRGFIDVRIGSLRLGTTGRFFEGGYPLDIPDLLTRNAVLEIEDLGNDSDKAFFIGAILIRLYEHLRTHPGDRRLRHITVIEEAHRLLKRAEPGTTAAHAVELFTSLLAEIRAYGEGLIVAEQIPAKISPDVVKNTALKILHRLPAAEDRDTVGATMNLDQAQSRHVVSLPPGRAAVFADGMDRPLRITVPLREHHEASNPAAATTPARSPLTLRDLDAAHRLARDPRIIVWIELVIIAHLSGYPPPPPTTDWLDEQLTRSGHPVVRAALAHRIHAGIDSRYTELQRYYQPEALTDRLNAVVDAWLHHAAPPLDPNPTRWQAGRFRWVDIERTLTATPAGSPAHPDTDNWLARGINLPGPTAADQLDQVRKYPDTLTDNSAVTGREQPSIISVAIDQLSTATTILERLGQATTHIHLRERWPIGVLGKQEFAP
ncbi:ATP-binding protein (plasmid) [Nocardia sp. NBC_01377]|uniref:ATP-binding protein n=1 Tax=Nocardia sp. NBC_01377 TaxID=2903595 RepID=UPI002F90AD76